MSIYHTPVMINEVIKYLDIKPTGLYLDLTFGGGGHAKEILKHLSTGHLYAFDQDQDTKIEAEKINNHNFTFINANALFIRQFMTYYNIQGLDGILADLGVSSHQIDDKERGFSTRLNARLDMRMNTNTTLTAYDIVNYYPEHDLEKVFRNYGELLCAKKLSKTICHYRKSKKIFTTNDLKSIILDKINIKLKNKIKILSQVFQALRIEVNNELNILQKCISYAINLLNANGKLVILSYHSLEDKIVKDLFRKSCKDHLSFETLTKKPLIPTEEEIKNNKRAHSAKMRVLRRKKLLAYFF